VNLAGNDSLRSIDLSWNNFRGRSAIDLINGLKVHLLCLLLKNNLEGFFKENAHLISCNLEMNGFGPNVGQALADSIKQNTTLEELNISGNRLNTVAAFTIAQALAVNETLQVFKVRRIKLISSLNENLFFRLDSRKSN